MAAIVYLEKQKEEDLLREAVETVIELIKEEQPEQLRMFTVWINRMFRYVLKEDDIEKINELTEVKSMLTQVVEKIEERAIHQGAKEKALETALKMKGKGYGESEIAEITGLSLEEIRKL